MELLCVMAALAALFLGSAALTLKARIPAGLAPLVTLSCIVAVLTLGVASAGGLGAVFENVKDFPGFLEFFGIADPVTEGGVQLAVNGVCPVCGRRRVGAAAAERG